MCLLVRQNGKQTPPKSLPVVEAVAGHPLVTIAKCQPDHWRKTQSRVCMCVCVCSNLKRHTFWLNKEAEGTGEWENESLNDAENWPVTVVHPSGKSLLQLAVKSSVPLSSHPTHPPHHPNTSTLSPTVSPASP